MDAWSRGAVIYQIAPRSFQDSDGDGVGDLPGITARLPYVASLGVDAVWITPFFRSPMADFGYDVADYRAVDPLFGTLADFEALLARAHGLGLKVLIDMVWSHTSDHHPWFRDHPDRYVWADPRPDGTPPNNWLSVFGGPAWTWEPRRRRYYLHHFLPSQPALDWRNPAVAEELLAVGRYWLDLGVDGFRLDAVDFLLHDDALRDNPPSGTAAARPFGMQRHDRDMAQEGVRDLLTRIGELGAVTIAELSSVGDPVARARTYCDAGVSAAYSLGLMRRALSELGRTIAEVEAKAGGGLAWAFSNHDIERVATRWGDGSAASAQALLALLLALRGTICLYQGEELGLPEAELAYDDLRDPFGKAFWPDFKGRDGSRTPMPWGEPGFTAGTPWLPLSESHRVLAADRQESDPASTLNVTRRLLRLRQEWPELRTGDLRLVPGEPLTFDRGRLRCVFNLAAAPTRVACPGRLVEAVGAVQEGGDVVFAGWGAAFIARAGA